MTPDIVSGVPDCIVPGIHPNKNIYERWDTMRSPQKLQIIKKVIVQTFVLLAIG